MKLLRLAVILAGIAGLSYMLFAYHAQEHQVSYACKAQYQFDALFSSSYKSAIKKFVCSEYEGQVTYGVAAVLEEAFVAIKTVTVDARDFDELCISVHAYKPVFALNDSYVVLETGCVVKSDIFSSKVLQSLVSFFYPVEQIPKRFSEEQVAIMKQCAQQYGHDYFIWWRNPQEILLQDKHNKHMQCMTRVGRLITQEDLSTCLRMHEHYVQKQKNKKMGGKQAWICDLRFANQVIVFPAK